jgi:RNA polymerase sigma-70 factor, ECF subfamily
LSERSPDWVTIVRQFGPLAFQTAWRILGHIQDTEDAVQDALLEALRTYRRQSVVNWGGLLRTAATHRALDRLRKRRKLSVLPADAPAPHADPAGIVAARELADWLRSVLAELPDRQAEVFSLRYFAELTNPEIGEALGISAEAVAVALHKARANIATKWSVVNDAQRNS